MDRKISVTLNLTLKEYQWLYGQLEQTAALSDYGWKEADSIMKQLKEGENDE